MQTARDRGYAKVMMGESLTRVAIKLLTNLSLGRGAFLAVDTVSWGRSPTAEGVTRCHGDVAWWWHSPLAALHPQGFTDQRHGDVMVVRPMRDYTAKEIAFYNHFFSVPTVIVPPLFTKVGGSCGGEPKLCVPMAGTGPPSPALPSLLVPTASGEAQHPPAGRALPAGAAGGVPLHHQHRVPVRGSLWGYWGWGGLGCTHTPPLWLQDRGEAEPGAGQSQQ